MVTKDQQCAGWLEVFYNGTWGSVCRSPMEDITVSVICRQLGCGDSGTLNTSLGLREGSRPRWVDGIRCRKTDTSLWQCPSDPWNYTSCSPKEEAYISCEGSRQLRLVDGGGPCAGRVEILDQGSWGTICDYSWDLDDARVVCRQLGCGEALEATRSSSFGAGSGPIWLNNLKCTGKESHVWRCSSWGWGKHYCDHSNNAGVICSGFVRLAGGDGPCSGRVEVYSGEAWIPVSDGNFTLPTAQVICAELGCGKAVSVEVHELFRASSARVWAEEFSCEGEEPELWVCPRVSCPGGTCHHSGAAQVVCSAYSEVQLMTNGSSQCEGQVEMNISGRWRGLCASHWSLANANVVCRQLGCGVAISTPRGPHLAEGSGQILTARFHCSGEESFLWSCPVTALGGPDCSHGNTASVICSGNQTQVLPQCNDSMAEPADSGASVESTPYCSVNRQLRLVDGGDPCAGRVEILDQGSWGTICDDGWDLEDARVVCRQLGCGEALNATGSAHFGTGSGPIWLDDLNCTGNESHVWRCPSRGWGQHDCRHKQDAGVICSEFLALRMVSEDQQCAGWLEVFYNGTWGSVCRSPMEDITVSMICRQLGCGDSGTLNSSVGLREGSRPRWVDGIRCRKTDTSLWQCPSDPWNYTSCSPKEEAYISCEGSRQLRLVDGGGPCAGRVEILDQGSWGTICDDRWDLDDAHVVCRQLGCGKALQATVSSSFGAGSGPIWLGNVKCTGKESHVWRCPSWGWGKHYCDHSEDAGVICSGFVRLAGGDGPCSGRVEVYSGEAWIPVSDGNFTFPTAQVICAELGCGKVVSVLGHELFRESDGQVWAEEFRCEGEEPELWVCPRVPCPGGTCHHIGAAQVVCSAYSEVRLMTNGSSQCEGQVEMNISGRWRVLCASPWSLANANVVCRQLGCGVAISTPRGPHLLEGGDQILTARFHCLGAESFLWSCPVTALGGPDCSHGNTASVICSGNQTQVLPQCSDSMAESAGSEASVESAPYCSDSRQLRLVDGGVPCAGRVEILDQGSWGTICDDGWDLDDARVVCRQLGCGEALNATASAHFGAGSGPIWLDDLNCTGNESHVWRCPSRGWGQHDCRHKQDAGVICSEFLALRMVSEDQQCAGWLEVFYNGTWGSVCRSPMEDITVSMICRQLGCGDSGTLNSSVGLREGSRPRWVDGIRCRKTDTSLWQCPSDPWNYTSCSPKEEAYILCAGSRQLRLVDGGGPCAGRVEILNQGSWGTICDYSWNMKDAHVVCRQLGCGEALDATRSSSFGAGSGPIWLDNVKCTGKESHVWRCPSRGWGKHYCDHSEDAGVICSGFVRLAGGDGPCSGRVEVHSGEAWTPVSDGNFTFPTAQVICAELGCGKAVSVLGQVPFRESDGRVWAEEFRCEGEEPKLWWCPRVPCPGGTCHHSGAVQIACSVYTDVRLLTNGSSQCEGQVEMNISGRWRALCASHWSLANANVVCRQLGCGVAISTPNGAEGSDQLWKARFHCSGTESFLWKCPVTALGVPDCSHGNTASVICSGNQTQVLPQCDHFVSEPAGSAASEESAPYCSDSRQLRLVDGGGPCAGRVEILDQGSWGTICDDGWDLDDARVVCRQLGCGEALNATGYAHFGAGSGPIWLDDLNCAGNESHVWTCPSRGWGQHDCRHKEDAGVICSEFLALRMVSEDQECAGWLEVFYNGTWGSVCRSPMEDTTVSVICRQLGCGDSGSLNTSVGLREGSRPRWVDLIQCRKIDTSLWQCPSGPWKYSSCSPKEEAYISCAGRRPKSCPTAAPSTDREKLLLRGGETDCSGRVEVWRNGSWGTVCDDSWSLAEAEVVCQQLGCGQALEAVQATMFGPGNGSIWLDEVQCEGWESSLWDCAAEPWGQSDCKHEEDAGVRCSGVRKTLPLTPAGSRPVSSPLPGIFSLPGVLCFILGSLLFPVLVILVTQVFRWRAERRASSCYEDALAEAVYEELDHLVTQKEGLLGSPGFLSDGEDNNDSRSAPAPDQKTYALGEGYDDAEEVPVPGAPPTSEGSAEEVLAEKEDGMKSETGSSLNIFREEADPGEGEESPWLLQGEKGDPGYDDVELSALGTSTVTFP
nr:antigen WC1.1-like isoform X3 [Ovis aries]